MLDVSVQRLVADESVNAFLQFRAQLPAGGFQGFQIPNFNLHGANMARMVTAPFLTPSSDWRVVAYFEFVGNSFQSHAASCRFHRVRLAQFPQLGQTNRCFVAIP
jgi:hypothetical protein